MNEKDESKHGPVYESRCDFCGEKRSRTNALSVEKDGRGRFICEECARRAGTTSYEQVFGDANWSPADLLPNDVKRSAIQTEKGEADELLAVVHCSKCKKEEVAANLDGCWVCDAFDGVCNDCLTHHIRNHSLNEIARAKAALEYWETGVQN